MGDSDGEFLGDDDYYSQNRSRQSRDRSYEPIVLRTDGTARFTIDLNGNYRSLETDGLTKRNLAELGHKNARKDKTVPDERYLPSAEFAQPDPYAAPCPIVPEDVEGDMEERERQKAESRRRSESKRYSGLSRDPRQYGKSRDDSRYRRSSQNDYVPKPYGSSAHTDKRSAETRPSRHSTYGTYDSSERHRDDDRRHSRREHSREPPSKGKASGDFVTSERYASPSRYGSPQDLPVRPKRHPKDSEYDTYVSRGSRPEDKSRRPSYDTYELPVREKKHSGKSTRELYDRGDSRTDDRPRHSGRDDERSPPRTKGSWRQTSGAQPLSSPPTGELNPVTSTRADMFRAPLPAFAKARGLLWPGRTLG